MSTTQITPDLSIVTTEQPNAVRMREAFAAFDRGDLDAVLADMADDCTWHNAGSGPIAGPHQGVLIARTLVLNGALGLLFGWLYARRNLEHAMLAHAASHVVFWTATPLLAALGM